MFLTIAIFSNGKKYLKSQTAIDIYDDFNMLLTNTKS